MNTYQLTMLINPDLEEKKRGDLLASVTKNFGKTLKEDLWGNKSLAYDINHQNKAFFAYYEFELEPVKISSLDKMVKLNEDIMRYLLLKVDPKKIKREAKAASKKEIVKEEKTKK
jgi:small subunit ribosomal protein S6